jgi:hypothetical protein
MREAGHIAHMGDMRNALNILIGKPEGKRPLRRPTCRWGDNIKMNIRETQWEVVEWIRIAQDMDRKPGKISRYND